MLLITRCAFGLLIAAVLAMAAAFVSEHHGGPHFLYALFFGIAFNFLAADVRIQPGIEIASQTLLRLGVALIGVRITFDEIVGLGSPPIALVAFALIATMMFGTWLAVRMKFPVQDGLLTSGAVAICGASAALAISAVLPKRTNDQFTLLTVVGVTLLSTIAMVLYPLIARLSNFDATTSGIFLGSTIHDVAQVAGAGYMISAETGDQAVLVKLWRVALLFPIVLVISFFYRSHHSPNKGALVLPWFLVAFAVLVLARTAQWLPVPVVDLLSDASRWCLVIAIAALGIKTSFQEFSKLGWRPVALLIGETLFLGLFVLSWLLIGHNLS